MTGNDRLSLDQGRRLIGELRDLGDVKAPRSLLGSVLSRVGLSDGYWHLDTSIGRIYLAYNARGIAAVIVASDDEAFERSFVSRFRRPVHPAVPPPALARQVARQLGGGRAGALQYDLQGISEFERAVLSKALEIPRGEVRPYAWIAREIGRPAAVRAVGTALGRNPVPLLIPCHRVVRSDGRIGDYAFGSDAKRAVLREEGVEVDELQRLASAGVRYHGSDTTRIYCLPTCRHARRIATSHRVAFGSAAEADSAGYRPCRVCRPALAMSS